MVDEGKLTFRDKPSTEIDTDISQLVLAIEENYGCSPPCDIFAPNPVFQQAGREGLSSARYL
jgi:hypothetical protein